MRFIGTRSRCMSLEDKRALKHLRAMGSQGVIGKLSCSRCGGVIELTADGELKCLVCNRSTIRNRRLLRYAGQ